MSVFYEALFVVGYLLLAVVVDRIFGQIGLFVYIPVSIGVFYIYHFYKARARR